MREGWEYKTLEETCNIDYGTRVVQKKDKGSTYYVYGGGGATFMIDRYNRENCFIVSRFAMSPKCTRFVEGRFFLNDSGLSVSTKNDYLRQRFLDKVLLANNDNIYSMGKGLAQRNLDMPSFRKLQIPIPPIPEQERIVSELDLLSSIIEKKKAQLKDLDNLAQSIFYDMFGDPVTNEKGWEVKKLGELCNSDLGKTLNQSKDTGKLRSYLCAINIQWNKIIKDNLKQTRFEDAELERYTVKKGDLLVCEGGDIGRAAIWNENEVIQYQNALHRLRFGKEMMPIFCLFVLKLLKDKDVLDNRYGKGVTIKHLVKSALLSIPFIVPPLSLQQSFAEKIEAIEHQKELIQQSISETETLFNSRMDYYFN